MIKAALSNGLIWTGIMFIIFYVAKKPITLEIFSLIFIVFTALGAIKYYYRTKAK